MSQYEVWCTRCDVSFPVGTKRCMHCGARPVGERPAKSHTAYASIGETDPRWATASGTTESRFEASDVHDGSEVNIQAIGEEEETPRRRGLRAGMSVIWMLLLAAGYVWQTCARPA
jgi:hypothetical protein